MKAQSFLPHAAEGKWDEERKGLHPKEEVKEELKGLYPKEEAVEGAAAAGASQYVPKAEPDAAPWEEERPKKLARIKREYMPRMGTNNEAFLITLLKARARRPQPCRHSILQCAHAPCRACKPLRPDGACRCRACRSSVRTSRRPRRTS